MIYKLNNIQEFLKNKNICLLGNSRSILNNPKNIDKYDIVCRINRGFPTGKEQFLGTRTDVLFIATKIDEHKLKKEFNPKYIIWTTPNDNRAIDLIKLIGIQNPSQDWYNLKTRYPNDKLPSTGCVAINFILKYIKFKTLDIFGFDFFETGTFYHNLKTQSWHPPELEKYIISNWIKHKKNVKLYEELKKYKSPS